MGVTGLWTVVAPTARPTQLATLNRKRLAVDASIWIYQFLKAVRDKEGNALRNSHVVGFFRRICKLLYFGIKPVFVFDGGAPVLKRETIRGRARRREGRREDAARTAGKLLAVQVARAAEEEEKRRRADRERTPVEEEVPDDQELVYVDEIGMSQKERATNRGFKRKDQYHLPDLDVSIESMGAPNDPRIMSQAELEEYARQFHRGEDINLYDFSKIDFESPFFLSLPPGDRYNILNAARLRSRLRMGYSKEQLDGMFPDRMAFSKFQIERVKERNELTQRLMHVNGMAEDYLHQGGRIAGEKGKEYVLVKNDGVEGGWALGVVSNKGKAREDAIDLDDEGKSEEEEVPAEEEDEFEDVAIEGLNRLPKTLVRKRQEVDYNTEYHDAAEEIAQKRKEVYEARKQAALGKTSTLTKAQSAPATDADSLFMPQPAGASTVLDDDVDELFEDVDLDKPIDEDDDDLQRAIAMSLEQVENGSSSEAGGFMMTDADESAGRKVAHRVNDASARQDEAQVSDDDEAMDLQAALAESRKSKYHAKGQLRNGSAHITSGKVPSPPPPPKKFNGPLPFESLNLGQSLLGKKKSKKVEEEMSGGFERDFGKEKKETKARPVPSWFNAPPTVRDPTNENEDVEEDDNHDEHISHGRRDVQRREHILQRSETEDIIDLETPVPPMPASQEVIEVDVSEDEMEDAEQAGDFSLQHEDVKEPKELSQAAVINGDKHDVRMDDVADLIQAEPPPSERPNFNPEPSPEAQSSRLVALEEDELVEWSESDAEDTREFGETVFAPGDEPLGGLAQLGHSADGNVSRSDGDPEDDDEEDGDFEDVVAPSKTPPYLKHEQSSLNAEDRARASQYLMADDEDDEGGSGDLDNGSAAIVQDDDLYMSDSDEELMRQLAVEAEEHVRFASSLNNKTPAEAARDYEMELKQLRNQQKKDRRDADEVTQAMIQECQALLRLFGLPYITAPMEAEAQCAELVHLGLVDGIVTDDSDIFLFGGTRVYKNMFNAAKFVECYLLADLEKEYALDRRKLIRFAHLLGSDYTEGIPGIGPVSALEILTEFETLEDFKEWCSKVQLGRPQDLENQLRTPFRRKFRNTAQKRLFLPPSFPDLRVDQAYLRPDVDSDPEPFQWGIPDLDRLRSFLMATIGWSQDRTDEILVPVIQDMNKRETEGTQANITRFFSGGIGVGAAKEGNAPRNRTGKESGRMAKAYGRLRGEAERRRRGLDGETDFPASTGADGGKDGPVGVGANASTENEEDITQSQNGQGTASRKKGTSKKKKAPTPDDEENGGNEESDFAPKKAPKMKRRKRAELA